MKKGLTICEAARDGPALTFHGVPSWGWPAHRTSDEVEVQGGRVTSRVQALRLGGGAPLRPRDRAVVVLVQRIEGVLAPLLPRDDAVVV
eukprot:CAMPEP_0195113260 /NCGR_PEP_ID=MMETSP0448-20130528/101732_1 /TAXON_ID=66468 /ORGANISM="Heterocapsa triquestra, Strain CCMP 448" /LENGTH=88 /DNA_ID=CAMNT_0040150173 /DNA_START=182 /DNA_END=445 /DNA_ORIENTATION=+